MIKRCTRIVFTALLLLGGPFAMWRTTSSVQADTSPRGTFPIAESRVLNKSFLGEPGASPPPYDLAELETYRRDGANVVSVHPTIEFTGSSGVGGPDHFCNDTLIVALYPQTPYTMYILKRWAKNFDGGFLTRNNGMPGLPEAGTPNVPTILDPRNTKGVVRRAQCDDNGWATFHVPDGTYFAVTDMMFFDDVHVEGHPYCEDMIVGDTGTEIYTQKECVEDRTKYSHVGDGWSVVSTGAKVSGGNSVETSETKGSDVVAHFATDFTIPQRLPSVSL